MDIYHQTDTVHEGKVRGRQNDLVAILLLLPHCFDRNAQKSAVSSLDIEAAAATAAVSLFSKPAQWKLCWLFKQTER